MENCLGSFFYYFILGEWQEHIDVLMSTIILWASFKFQITEEYSFR